MGLAGRPLLLNSREPRPSAPVQRRPEDLALPPRKSRERWKRPAGREESLGSAEGGKKKELETACGIERGRAGGDGATSGSALLYEIWETTDRLCAMPRAVDRDLQTRTTWQFINTSMR